MPDLVNVTIDDIKVSVPAGTLVVDAAKAAGIEIPVFCSHPKLDPLGACRMCIVEFPGPRGSRLDTACTVRVSEGMAVRTDTEQVKKVREANLGFILINHPLDCPICDKGGECPLQDQTMEYGPGVSQFVEVKRAEAEALSHQRPDHARPGALHPVLALHPLPGRVGGQAAARPVRARGRHGHRHLPRPAGGRQDVGQHLRHLPGGRADQPRLPLPLSAVGDQEDALRLHALPGRLQRAAGRTCARAAPHRGPREHGGERRVDLRQGAVPASVRRSPGPAQDAAGARGRETPARDLGRGAGPDRRGVEHDRK